MKLLVLAILIVAVVLVSGCTSEKVGSQATGINQSQVKLANNYFRFDPQAYQSALEHNKTILLFFKANWCPTCAESVPRIHNVFNEMKSDDVIGFEVHFNDEESQDFDNEIIRKYQIAYQNALVILDKNGKEAFRTLAYITEDKIRSGIEKARGY